MGEIDTVLLGDIAEITAGQSPPGFTINRSGDGVPFFQGAKDFGARYPQVRTYTTAPARLASPGDILLSVRAPIGRVNRCQAKCAIGRGVSALRSRSEIALTDYLEYWLRAYEPRWYQHESAGSVFSNLSTTELLHLELSLPPLSEQRAIAEVLGALDDKIEANRRLSNLCDALWQTMAAEVFDDIEDGVITSGDLQPLSSIATFVNGKAFTKDATGTGRMVVRIAELNSGPGASTIYNEIEVPAEHIAAPGDLLFAWSGSLTVQRWYRPEAIINQHIFKVVPRSNIPMWCVHAHLLRLLPAFRRIAAGKATTMGHIQRHDLDVEVGVPDSNMLTRLDSVCAPLWHRALRAEMETLILSRLRDTLLPKLMSGEIRVRGDDIAALIEVSG